MPSIAPSVAAAVGYIAAHQGEDGSIPWFPGGTLDPWNHVECAMALDVGGRHHQAQRAYLWLPKVQNSDGSFWAGYAYQRGVAADRTRDSNLSSYLAVGAWHHYLVTGDLSFLQGMWPTVRRAMEFVLGLQAEHGGVYWARDGQGRPWPDCLVAGSSCVRAALLCAERIADELGQTEAQDWKHRRARLEAALLEREAQFGRTFGDANKSRFAMDWYYPVLCGVVRGREAQDRLEAHCQRFIETGLGVRCVEDEPWVTIAESCELAIALDAVGERPRGRQMLAWQLTWQEEDGGFRTGTAAAGQPWPEGERPTWTAAAFVLAADALYDLTPAAGLFRWLHRE